MLVKILGCIDLITSSIFLMLIFSIQPPVMLVIFCATLLLLKGMFIFFGELLSIIDLFSSLILFLSLLFIIPIVMLWIPAFFLLSKAVVSFL